MPIYLCPVCKKDLTEEEYESALGILEEKEQHLKKREEKIKTLEEEFRRQKALLIDKAKKARQEGETEGQRRERKRAERLMAGQQDTIAKLHNRIRQLERGSTPQTEGLEFEDKLAKRLEQEFLEDTIEQHGKGGDILHFVLHNGKAAGTIVYECKRRPKSSCPTSIKPLKQSKNVRLILRSLSRQATERSLPASPKKIPS